MFFFVSDIYFYVIYVWNIDVLLWNGMSIDVLLVFGYSELVSVVGIVV